MMYCKNCGKEIKSKEDANVLAFLGFVPKSFCNNCYSSKERGFARHFIYFPRQPINSKIYIFGLVFFSLFFIMFSIFAMLAIYANQSTGEKTIISFILIAWLIISIWQWVLYFNVKRKISELK